MKVLIVDDANILRIVLKDILMEFCKIDKKDIFEASDGIMAIKEYQRIKPDIVFLDISMPNLGGRDAVRAIIQFDPEAKIIMCSSAKDMDIVKECILSGAKDFLSKPLMPARVAEALRNCMQ